jgi:hypothetical protein
MPRYKLLYNDISYDIMLCYIMSYYDVVDIIWFGGCWVDITEDSKQERAY